MLLFYILTIYSSLVCFARSQQPAPSKCSQSNPCEKGCCNTHGNCGFGPDFCSPTACVDTCDRKSQCRFDTWPSGYSDIDTCPLNVCCSKHGYCGTGTLFCGDKSVRRPSCETRKTSLQRVIGYYEGWGPRRVCDQFFPEDLPSGVYTHLNFAFATIDPATFEIRPSHPGDIALYYRMAKLKANDPFLETYIAIGGWTFNDPGPTQHVFSELAGSLVKQRAFFSSLIRFMATYDFDGVDIDWEYPGADDRGGKQSDYENFPKFMANLKDALKSSGGRTGLSATLPASYWYLQHFDVKKLEESVDFFNIMSYDMHGLWDKNNTWTGPFLNAHNNLTEIRDALDLLWRNDISPKKVVMGIGFYGRSFTASDRNCLEPKCGFENAGEEGKCSREAGILTLAEITDTIKKKSLVPKLYKDETTKVISWQNQWIGYDDAQTFRMKADFAKSQCLGGLMVWAVTHDMKDGRYSMALGEAAGRKGVLALKSTSGYKYSEMVPKKQCRWTNCGETCPDGFTPIERTDKGKRKGPELMLDGSGCADGVHTWCCPVDFELPQCGWYSHNNGDCAPSCPQGTLEIGGNNEYCRRRGTYQAACCTHNSKSMAVYLTCRMRPWPNCDNQRVENICYGDFYTELGQSGLGQGTPCGTRGGGSKPSLPQAYCCDTRIYNRRFEECEWADNFGYRPEEAQWQDACLNDCPPGKMRVIQDDMEGGCKARHGFRALCCKATVQDFETVDNGELGEFQSGLESFFRNPYCVNPAPAFPFQSSAFTDEFFGSGLALQIIGGVVAGQKAVDLSMDHDYMVKNTTALPPPTDVAARDTYIASALAAILGTAQPDAYMRGQIEVWNAEMMRLNLPNLQIITLQQFIRVWPTWHLNPFQAAHVIVCNPHLISREIAIAFGFGLGWGISDALFNNYRPPENTDGNREDEEDLDCGAGLCDREGRGACVYSGPEVAEDASDEEDRDELRRYQSPQNSSDTYADELVRIQLSEGAEAAPQVGKARPFTVVCTLPNGNEVSKGVKSRPYPQTADLSKGDPLFSETMDYSTKTLCDNINVDKKTSDGKGFDVEHIVELNTIHSFINDVVLGIVASRARLRSKALPCNFINDAFAKKDYLTKPPELPRDAGVRQWKSRMPAGRLYDALGSTTNKKNLVYLEEGLNGLKNRVWQGAGDPTSGESMKTWRKSEPKKALAAIRDVFVVFAYMVHPNVHPKMISICNNVRDQLQIIEEDWNNKHASPADKIELVANWDEWIRDKLKEVVSRSKKWLASQRAEMEAEYAGRVNSNDAREAKTASGVMQLMRMFASHEQRLVISDAGLK